MTKKRTKNKIPRCPKTVSGKHYWTFIARTETNYLEIEDFYRCVACGLVDDKYEHEENEG